MPSDGHAASVGNAVQFLKNVKNKNLHTYNLLISSLNVYLIDMVIRIYSRTDTQKLNVNGHSNFSHKSRKEERIPVATNPSINQM